ncbi:hypothetical protein [Candidatus Methanoperedens nitratireducens]|nr:hypothetical protein [Candidatus Methanoperedens nitroreducens]
MTEMVVKGFGSVHKNERVGEKGFNESLYKYVAIIIGIFIIAAFVWSNMPLAKTVSNSIQTTTGVSTSDTSTGAANPSQVNNAGQETDGVAGAYIAGVYTPKFYPKGDTIYQGVDIDNIPAIIPFNNGKVYIKDMKRKEDYLSGNLGAASARYNERVSFTILDSNGQYLGGNGPFTISDEKESSFKIPIPANAKYLVISNG